jgi:hypothetical protein
LFSFVKVVVVDGLAISARFRSLSGGMRAEITH